jgi:2-methylisocitrate lyase-like PEP mutase family enzyme
MASDGMSALRDKALALGKLHTSGTAVARITRRVSVPVTADMEAGFGLSPDAVAETARGVLSAGAVGMNLEDSGEGDKLFEFDLSVARVRAAREAGTAAGVPLVLNARTDAFHPGTLPPDRQFAEAVRRGNAYREAGADCVFVPFVGDSGTIGGSSRRSRRHSTFSALPTRRPSRHSRRWACGA